MGFTIITSAGATYAGDRPLVTSFYDDGPLQYLYTLGDSVYRGSLGSEESYLVSYSVTIPPEASIQFERLYVYWAWSRIHQNALYPTFSLTDSRNSSNTLKSVSRFVDSKGVVSTYDFYSGTDVYAPPALIPGENEFTVMLTQKGPPQSTVLIYGIALLVIYEDTGQPMRRIWVKEGCDLLFSSYGISPEMASHEMVFEGALPIDGIEEAELVLVAPSGGYSRDLAFDINQLLVNRLEEEKTPPLMRTIFSLLFPNYRGKEWNDIFSLDSLTQIGLETREIRPYLRRENNKIILRDQGDYLQLTNAILAIRMEGEQS
jgi:hypothetical protein